MNSSETAPLPYVREFGSLRKLIADNPELPICFIATDSACDYDYASCFCDDVSVRIGEVLNCQQDIKDDICFDDRDAFEEAVFDMLSSDDVPEAVIEAETKRIVKEYDPYWVDCIIVTVSN